MRGGRSLEIPDDEISFRFSPSGGPGGQHANRSSTRVELVWNVERSRAPTTRQRRLIKAHLRSRIDAGGDLHLVSDTHRSQLRNRAEVQKRLQLLVAEALRPRAERIATQPTRAAHERRLKAKRRRSQTKRLRRVRTEE